jgi:type IV pilus biogenesis protein CpaD/CtpE
MIGPLAVIAALALAGCEAMPLGGFDRAETVASRSAGPYLLYFTPESATLAPGEAQRLTSYLQTLRLGADQDILLEVGNSGSAVLDARRLQALDRTFAGSRAPVRVVVPKRQPVAGLSNAVRVTVVDYDLLVVACPAQEVAGELTTPLPPIGCSNAVNRATMAADKRDVVAPRGTLPPSNAGVDAAAVERYRDGKVITLPISVIGG